MTDVIYGSLPTPNDIKGTLATEEKMSGNLATVFAKDGKSAYEVAVKNGFEGTEEEWLASLQGKQGIQGIQGEKGDKGDTGEQGIQGIQGKQGEKGDKGDAFTYSDFTSAQLASLKGEKGDKGDKGNTGEKGDTGNSGVYLGSGDMPDDCNVQIDPDGDVFSLEKSPSRNLLNVTWENANLDTNGVLVNATNNLFASTLDYVPVVGGENYTLSWIKNDKEVYIYLNEYAEDKSYIKYTNLTATNAKSVITKQLDASCAFVRIKLWKNGTAPETWEENIPQNFQMELGTEATTYVEPLTIDMKNIDDIALAEKMGTNGVIPKADNYLDRLPLTETLPVEAWETAGINANGEEYESTHRLRTIDYIQMRKGDSIYLNSGDVFEYDLITKEFISSVYTSGWKTEYIVQNDCFVRIVLYWSNILDDKEKTIKKVSITRNNRDRLQFPALPIDKLRDFSQNVADERIADARLVTNRKYTASQNPLFKQIAHRGFRGTDAPQCTAPAYIEAKKFGYSGGENDLQKTYDGVFVMAHDAKLPSNGSVIADSTYNDLVYNGNMGFFNGKEADIMTFEEWLVLMKKIGLEPYVDLKFTLETVEQATEVMAIVRKHGLLDKVTWSGNLTSATNLRAVYANARIALIYSNGLPNFDSVEDLVIEGHPELTVLYMKSTLVDEAFMSEAISRGFSVECWHCDYSASGFTTEEAILGEVERVLKLGVTGICLDTYLPCEYFINKFNSEWGL